MSKFDRIGAGGGTGAGWGNGASRLEHLAGLLMDAVGLLHEEIDERRKKAGDGNGHDTEPGGPESRGPDGS
jgi:hypothetical protein